MSPGTMGLKGDLTAGEIVEQLLHAQRVTRIKNIVFMVSCCYPALSQEVLGHNIS